MRRVRRLRSAWIWNTAAELFPQAIQILDRFHAKEHLSKVGKLIYRDSKQGKKWGSEQEFVRMAN